MKPYTHIIWDWNGTLLDDAAWSMQCINHVLALSQRPPFFCIEGYREVFGFPTRDYYIRAGLDFADAPFETLAQVYIDRYHGDGGRSLALFDDAAPALAAIAAAGIKQVILSASRIDHLQKQLAPFDIAHHFDEILGISDFYATGKTDIGRAYAQRNGIMRGVLIGDTTHDAEVARAIGVDCVLVARGHQSRKRLLACGVPVAEDLVEALAFVL